jgi:hypothetical protein
MRRFAQTSTRITSARPVGSTQLDAFAFGAARAGGKELGWAQCDAMPGASIVDTGKGELRI